ncbi:MAG: hypothetical protein QOK31_298 [Solirubrobacteraceae bacterium]|nr:hypothetical protein [Solirubrobacteraceae bacterium]
MDEETRRKRRELAHQRVVRQRRLAALSVLGLLLVLIVVLSSGGKGNGPGARRAAAPAPPPQLPRGGRTLLPRYRVVAFYGAPESAALGQLGIGSPALAAQSLRRQAAPYARGGREIMPAFELLATVASHSPGDDGQYRTIQPDAVISRYLHAARRAHAILVLDLQPGYEPFMTEVRRLRRYLVQPDVSLALDPEWSLRPPDVPGQKIGSTQASVVNEASAYLADLVRTERLPQKLLLVHQFTESMIADRAQLRPSPGVALVLNVDGVGDQPNKIAKYRSFTRHEHRFYNGFKLFYHEDTNLLAPRQALRLRPRPDVLVYE